MKKQTVKRRIRYNRIIAAVFFVMFGLYLATSIGLKSYNVSLIAKQKQVKAQIVQTKAEIDTISVAITDLEQKSRVLDIIDDSMSTNNVTNIVDLTK